MHEEKSISERWNFIKHEVEESAISCGRNPNDITIIAVSKMHPLSSIHQAYDAGARVFGENYAQEFRDKIRDSQAEHFYPEWHFIGALQSNKVKYVIPHAALIHSCSTISVAEEIQRLSEKHDIQTNVLIQINTSGESSKSGIDPGAIDEVLESFSALSRVKIRGLMTIPTATENISRLSHEFASLRRIHERMHGYVASPEDWNILSMGMSDDFAIAIKEGATHVRIGTAIFGERV